MEGLFGSLDKNMQDSFRFTDAFRQAVENMKETSCANTEATNDMCRIFANLCFTANNHEKATLVEIFAKAIESHAQVISSGFLLDEEALSGMAESTATMINTYMDKAGYKEGIAHLYQPLKERALKWIPVIVNSEAVIARLEASVEKLKP